MECPGFSIGIAGGKCVIYCGKIPIRGYIHPAPELVALLEYVK